MSSLLSLFDNSSEDDSKRHLTRLSDEICNLPPECEHGNIEYKLKLVKPSPNRLQHLITQMKWRLQEGQGEAFYEIGVEDNGELRGLSQRDLDESLKTLHQMAHNIGASVLILREKICENNFKVLEVLVRKLPKDLQTIEVRIIVLGNVEVGKSSLLGVLTQGELDNGKGRARLNLFRHRHEVRSGRTSSINKEILGFDDNGTPITYNTYQTPEEICELSSKIIVFIDSGGHPKYLKTAVFSLTAMHADYAILVINALVGIDSGTNMQHFSLALALEVPVMIVINKIDLCDKQTIDKTLNNVKQLITSSFCKNKTPFIIQSENDIFSFKSHLFDTNIIPIFLVSCVNGQGVTTLYKFLQSLKPSLDIKTRESLMKQNTRFQIDQIFNIPNIGVVVSGFLSSGLIKEGTVLKAGPFDNGKFVDVYVSSVQRHKVSRRVVRPGESSTLALEAISNDDLSFSLPKAIRKGMVLLSDFERKSVCLYFKAKIIVMLNSSPIHPSLHTTVYIENIRQNIEIIAIMNKESIDANKSGSVIIRFVKYPQYIQTGCRLLIQQGQVKAIGTVTRTYPYKVP